MTPDKRVNEVLHVLSGIVDFIPLPLSFRSVPGEAGILRWYQE
jgi:hypothetical protein